jgi:hypothetical protein
VKTSLSAQAFGQLFHTFRSSAFRLETLPAYDVADEGEELRMFLEGKPKPERAVSPWQQMIRSHVEAGRQMQRVHLVRGDLTDYLRWEIGWGYPDNAAAGEDIRILQVGPGELPELGEEDFWLFDDELAVLMRYGPGGEWLGQDSTRNGDVVEACRRKRDVALSLAVPLSTFLAEVGT